MYCLRLFPNQVTLYIHTNFCIFTHFLSCHQDSSFCFSLEKPAFLTSHGHSQTGKGGAVAPMPGIIEKIFVEDGQSVKVGEPLLVMIAMKMEYVIRAPEAGIVEKVFFKVGDNVAKNAALVQLLSEPKQN